MRTALCLDTLSNLSLDLVAVSAEEMGTILHLGTPGSKGTGARPGAVCEWACPEGVLARLQRTATTLAEAVADDHGVVYVRDDAGAWVRRTLERDADLLIVLRGN